MLDWMPASSSPPALPRDERVHALAGPAERGDLLTGDGRFDATLLVPIRHESRD
jgi:hypothetical protein